MTPAFTEVLLHGGVAVLGLATLSGLYRMIAGPTALDRILAFDTVAICVIGIFVLFSWKWRTPEYLELILILTALGFFTTVVCYFFLIRQPRCAPEFTDAPPARPPGREETEENR